MNTKTIVAAVVGAGALGILVFLGIRSQNRLSEHLPPKEIFATRIDAYIQALRVGGSPSNVTAMTGSPSMEPFIHGRAFVVVDHSIGFDAIGEGDVIVYKEDWLSVQGFAAHVVAATTSSGLIMAGINNRAYESTHRVTRELYAGKVVFVADWPQ